MVILVVTIGLSHFPDSLSIWYDVFSKFTERIILGSYFRFNPVPNLVEINSYQNKIKDSTSIEDVSRDERKNRGVSKVAELQLDAEVRTITGRKVKQLRREGLVPVVVYGNNQENQSLQVGSREFERVLRSGGSSQLVEVNVPGQETLNVLVRDIQFHPVRRTVTHADLYAINIREKQQVTVSIVQAGNSDAESSDTMILQLMDSITIEALPTNIPFEIECDIAGLTMENNITVADLPGLEGVDYLSEPDEAIFSMVAVRTATVEGEGEEEEGAVTEPEVMSKGKADEEEV